MGTLKWRMIFNTPDGQQTVYCKSKEKVKANTEAAEKRGWTLVSCEKLYPFGTEKNQHNFDLIHNVCYNAMHDMETGDTAYDEDEYNRLHHAYERAEYYFCLSLPVAWLTWEELAEARELVAWAVNYRMDANERAGKHVSAEDCQ